MVAALGFTPNCTDRTKSAYTHGRIVSSHPSRVLQLRTRGDTTTTSISGETSYSRGRDLTCGAKKRASLLTHLSRLCTPSRMIRDRIIVGIRNRGLSEKLQLDSKLTLETAVSQVRQAEAVNLQQSVLRGSCADTRYPCRRSSKRKKRTQGETVHRCDPGQPEQWSHKQQT